MNEPIAEVSHASLKEFREKPQGFTTVFIAVPRASLPEVLLEGLTKKNIDMGAVNPELEDVFQQSAKEHGISVSRLNCVFAYPIHPEEMSNRLHFDPRQEVLLEALVDPKKAMVVNADMYTEAQVSMRENKGPEIVQNYANGYWEEAQTLSDFLSKLPNENERSTTFLEVLVPENINPNRIRIAPNQPAK